MASKLQNQSKNIQICSKCIYDEMVPSINFDQYGVCNYCHMVDELIEEYGTGNSKGKKIFENVSKQAWADWLKQQTMLLNENRLSLVDPQARKYLTEQTEAYFFGSGADTASGYVPPTK